MKAVLLNGSPRKGNTRTALDALKRGLTRIDGLEVTEINATAVHIAPCVACGVCKKTGNCVRSDDTNTVLEEILQADILVFALPVYWWGIPAQLKLIIDKFYAKADRLAQAKKQIGVLMVGQLSAENVQYQLIGKQIECISAYLGWEMRFAKAYSAYDPTDLAADEKAIWEIENLCKTFSDASI